MSPSAAKRRTTAMIVGLILSAYAVYVEYKTDHKDPNDETEFVALCDIEALGASCSKVFALPQGRMLSYFGLVPVHSVLDLPNAGLGIIHYIYMLTLASHMPTEFTSFMVTAAFLSTIFLAYELTFVQFELCVLCWSTHVINTYTFYSHFFGKTSSATKKKAE